MFAVFGKKAKKTKTPVVMQNSPPTIPAGCSAGFIGTVISSSTNAAVVNISIGTTSPVYWTTEHDPSYDEDPDVRTIKDILTDEEADQVEAFVRGLGAEKDKAPLLIKYLLYERIRLQHNNGILAQQNDELRKLVFYAPPQVAEAVEAQLATSGERIIFDVYDPAKDGR